MDTNNNQTNNCHSCPIPSSTCFNRFPISAWQFIARCAGIILLLLTACTNTPTPEPTAAAPLPSVTHTATQSPISNLQSPTSTSTPSSTITTPPTLPIPTSTPEPASTTIEQVPTTSTPFPTRLPTNTPSPTAVLITAGPLPPPLATADIWTDIGTPMPIPQAIISPDNAAQLTLLGRWGKGKVIDAAYSPDGQQLVAATTLGVYLYEAATANQIRFISARNDQLTSMAVSPDWQTVAMVTGNQEVELWRLNDGMLLSTLTAADVGTLVAFTPDGQHLIATSAVWRLSDGLLLNDNDLAEMWSPNTQIAANFYFEEGEVEISQVALGADQVATIPAASPIPLHFEGDLLGVFSFDGQLLALGGWGTNVEVWRVPDRTLLYLFETADRSSQQLSKGAMAAPSHRSGPGPYHITDMAFSPDGQKIAITTGLDETTIWDLNNGRLLNRLEGVSGGVLFSPDATILASWESSLTQWRLSDNTPLITLNQHMGSITDLTFTPDGSQLLLASDLIYFRRVSDGALFTTLSEPAGHIALSTDSQTLVSSSDDQLFIWNLADGTAINLDASNASWGISDVAISPDGQYVATAASDDAVKVWRIADGELMAEGFSMDGDSLAFSPAGDWLAFRTHDADAIGLWPVSSTLPPGATVSFNIANKLVDPSEYLFPYSVVFSPDGLLLAAGLHDGRILVWQFAERRLIYKIAAHYRWVGGVAFSPDGRLLASVSYDGSLRIWRTADGLLLHTIPLPVLTNGSVTFSPDGRLLAVGLWDGTVRLWGIP